MDLNLSIKNYLEILESSSPTPGGGNVSAFCGVLAAALGKMVCELTIGKKKYLNVEQEMKDYLAQLSELKLSFEDLANKDNKAFDLVMDAFKMPKETEEQKASRLTAIENATKGAANVPFLVIQQSLNTLKILENVAEKGNKNSISDAGVALLLLQTASKGAFLNVIINCSSLNDKEFSSKMINDSTNLISEIDSKVNQLFLKIKQEILNEN